MYFNSLLGTRASGPCTGEARTLTRQSWRSSLVLAQTIASIPSAQMDLTLLRHGKAADRLTWTGNDADRPLTEAGQARTRAVLTHLNAVIHADEIWTSPWLRARQTAEIAGQVWGLPVREQAWLAGGACSEAEQLGHLADLGPDQHIILVGHEPDLSCLAGYLCGGNCLGLKKAGLALLRGEATAQRMHLRALLSPAVVLGIASDLA